ncbi:MAG: multiheme c-type cytochrome [Myxococcota bacterium]
MASPSLPASSLLRLSLLRLSVIVGLAAGLSAPADAEHQYVGAGKCGTCHKKELIGNQLAVWRAGPHARAYETLTSERSASLAAERGLAVPAHEAAECLECHATSQAVPEERRAYPLEITDGVQCESCHGPGRDYRKKSIMSNRGEALTKGLWEAGKDSGLCTRCHNDRSPTFDPERYVLPDGSTLGFEFDLAKQRILHEIPPEVKGNYVELEKKQKAEARRRRAEGR